MDHTRKLAALGFLHATRGALQDAARFAWAASNAAAHLRYSAEWIGEALRVMECGGDALAAREILAGEAARNPLLAAVLQDFEDVLR